MSDIYTKIRLGCGLSGGFKCPCCDPTPNRGKNRKRMKRFLNRRARRRLESYLPTKIEEQNENSNIR